MIFNADGIHNNDSVGILSNNRTSEPSSAGDFPICTAVDGPVSPFCLPQDGTDMTVDATYYVTWNADYYPLNATITIELRYSNSSQGDSAFTSEKTANSYGYITLYMRKEWLQAKSRNYLTLYIIELDPTSGRRASARQGPTITLHPKPIEHYKPPPQLPYNRLALLIGLPVSLAVVILVVAGLFFGMRERRKIAVGNIMGSRDKGYAIGKSKNQRLGSGGVSKADLDRLDGLRALRKYTDDYSERSSEASDLEHSGSNPFKHEVSRLKSWSGC